MEYLYAIFITGTLTLLYIGVLLLERTKQKRFFEKSRVRLDKSTARAVYIWKSVDWGGFLSHLLGTTVEKILHDIVHGILIVTRGIEKNLTRAIRTLRTRISERNNGTVVEGFQLKETMQKFQRTIRKRPHSGEEK